MILLLDSLVNRFGIYFVSFGEPVEGEGFVYRHPNIIGVSHQDFLQYSGSEYLKQFGANIKQLNKTRCYLKDYQQNNNNPMETTTKSKTAKVIINLDSSVSPSIKFHSSACLFVNGWSSGSTRDHPSSEPIEVSLPAPAVYYMPVKNQNYHPKLDYYHKSIKLHYNIGQIYQIRSNGFTEATPGGNELEPSKDGSEQEYFLNPGQTLEFTYHVRPQIINGSRFPQYQKPAKNCKEPDFCLQFEATDTIKDKYYGVFVSQTQK